MGVGAVVSFGRIFSIVAGITRPRYSVAVEKKEGLCFGFDFLGTGLGYCNPYLTFKIGGFRGP